MKKLLLLMFVSNLAMASIHNNIKVISFIENKVVALNVSTFTVTEIQFGNDERIWSIQNGDLAAWTVDVSKSLRNTLFLKPMIVNSNTNMTVITDRHTYYFQLSSEVKKKHSLYAITFRYPRTALKHVNLNGPHLPSAYHWNYSFHGSTTIMPLHVFDDGRFTYFQLRPGQELPAIFSVDSKSGEESIVNFRREGRYLVVHRLAPQFTLRSGKHRVASIFNNRFIRDD